MTNEFKKIQKKRTIDETLVGATILGINRNKETGRFVLILDNGNLVHVGAEPKDAGTGVVLSRKKY